jgi:hypothetical protein
MADDEKKQPKAPKISRGHSIMHIPGTQIKAEHKFTLGSTDNKIFSCKFSNDDTYVATGNLLIFNNI